MSAVRHRGVAVYRAGVFGGATEEMAKPLKASPVRALLGRAEGSLAIPCMYL
jgi:hypothetical protein